MATRRKSTKAKVEEKPEVLDASDEAQGDMPEQETDEPTPAWPLARDLAGFYRASRSRAYVSEGEHVSALQERLGVPATGVYDDVTATAVREFRASSTLPAGDYVDEETWASLFRPR